MSGPRISDESPEPLRSKAEKIVGVSRDRAEELPHVDRGLWRQVKNILEEHHNEGYGPTYLRELYSKRSCWTPFADKLQRHSVLTPNSVYVVVQLDENNCFVLTAYRPHPHNVNVNWSEDDLIRYGRNNFASKNNMRISNFKQIIVKELEKCSSAIPTSVRELWWLALAVGYGRLLAYNEDVKTILSRAEKKLTKVKPEIVEQLAASLDWPGCIEGIASALKDDYPEELEAVLVAFEELLVIADAIEEQETSRIFNQQAGELLAWLPAKWDHLIDFAGSRCEIFNEIDSSAGLLWANIEEALLGAVMRESETDIRPEPRLANVVLPPINFWTKLKDRVFAIQNKISEPLELWAKDFLDGISVESPAPVMGDSLDEQLRWDVFGKTPKDDFNYRAFIVSEGHEDGYEVTDKFNPEDEYLWYFDKKDEKAILVLVVSNIPVCSEKDLDELLVLAENRNDITVRLKELSPPR